MNQATAQLVQQLKVVTGANRFAFLQKTARDKIAKSSSKPA